MDKNLSRLDKELIKKITNIKATTSGLQTNVSYDYPSKRKLSDGTLVTKTASNSFVICNNPTNNCQLNSFLSFYRVAQAFQNSTTKNMNEVNRWNNRAMAWGYLKALAYYCKNKNTKRQYFIDIKQDYKPCLAKFNRFLFTRRNKSKEVDYISTNGSEMMYTVLVIDADKRDRLLEIK